MRVIIYAQDLSGRRDDGYYTKSNISTALDIFFGSPGEVNFLDTGSESVLDRQQAADLFDVDGRVCFYNSESEKIVITKYPTP